MTRTFALSGLALAVFAATAPTASAAPAKLETAIFAGGCFWTVEHDFELLPGVVKAEAGYAGGKDPHPTYRQVSSETTDYLESVKVTWDPTKTSYARLVNRFWRMIDPTDATGQVCDHGPSYHSAIFVDGPEQRRIAEESLAEIDKAALKGRIVTQIRPTTVFWPAEAVHQGFARTHAAEYSVYSERCGRNAVLARIWGDDAEPMASERQGRK